MTQEVRKTYVELFYPGIFMPETSCVVVKKRDPMAIATKYTDAFAFTFHDVIEAEVTVGGQKKTATTSRLNESKRYYPNAKRYDLSEIEHAFGPGSVLFQNMKSNNWDAMVRCNRGNYQPLLKGDEIL